MKHPRHRVDINSGLNKERNNGSVTRLTCNVYGKVSMLISNSRTERDQDGIIRPRWQCWSQLHDLTEERQSQGNPIDMRCGVECGEPAMIKIKR
jgi:hypothetical protein